MSSINGPDDFIDFGSFLDVRDDALNEPEENTIEEKTYEISVTIMKEKYFVLDYDPNNKGTLHFYSLDIVSETFEMKDLRTEEKQYLDPTKKLVIKVKTDQKGNEIIETHEKVKKYIENRSAVLHSRGADGEEIVEDLSNRNVVWVGLNDAQYRSIFVAANQQITRFAEEYKKNKEKHEKGLNSSFYERFNFFKKNEINRFLGNLSAKIEEYIFINLRKSSKNLDQSSSDKIWRKTKEETKEKAYEERMESYQKNDKAREIRKEFHNKQDIKKQEDTNEVK